MSDPRIVVFRPGALGDSIVAADALAAIRGGFPDCTIELVGNAPAAALLRASGLVDVVTPFDSLDVARLFERTSTVVPRWRNAELVVLWLKDAGKIAQAFRAAGARRVLVADPRLVGPRASDPHPARAFGASLASPAGRGETSQHAFGTADVPSPEERGDVIHISDYLVDSLRPTGISPITSGPALLEPGWPLESRLPGAHTALLHPGSGSPNKNWPPDRFAALAARLLEQGWTVRLLRGSADADAIANVRALVIGSQIAVEEPADIPALAEILAAADLYVGNDSGVSHVSARLGVPTVAIFGLTDPREWAPRGPRVSVVDGVGAWPSLERIWDALLALTGETRGNRNQGDALRGAARGLLQEERGGEEHNERENRDSVNQS